MDPPLYQKTQEEDVQGNTRWPAETSPESCWGISDLHVYTAHEKDTLGLQLALSHTCSVLSGQYLAFHYWEVGHRASNKG